MAVCSGFTESAAERLVFIDDVQRPPIPMGRPLYFAAVVTVFLLITVARDSGRLLYFGRVIFYLFIFFFRPPNFRRPWADFRETLPHDAVCAEIVYLL